MRSCQHHIAQTIFDIIGSFSDSKAEEISSYATEDRKLDENILHIKHWPIFMVDIHNYCQSHDKVSKEKLFNICRKLVRECHKRSKDESFDDRDYMTLSYDEVEILPQDNGFLSVSISAIAPPTIDKVSWRNQDKLTKYL